MNVRCDKCGTSNFVPEEGARTETRCASCGSLLPAKAPIATAPAVGPSPGPTKPDITVTLVNPVLNLKPQAKPPPGAPRSAAGAPPGAAPPMGAGGSSVELAELETVDVTEISEVDVLEPIPPRAMTAETTVPGRSPAIMDDPFATAVGARPGNTEDPFDELPPLEAATTRPLPSPVPRAAQAAQPRPTAPMQAMSAERRRPIFETGFHPFVPIEVPPSRMARVINAVATALSLAVLIGSGVYFLFGDTVLSAIDPKYRAELVLPEHDGVRVQTLRAVKYPTRNGSEILVVSGEATAANGQRPQGTWVVAELRAANGRVVSTGRAPLGFSLGPPELADITSPAGLEQAFQRAATQPPVTGLQPYTVVILEPPRQAPSLVYTLRLEKGPPLVAPAPPVLATPPEAGPPPEAAPAVEDEALAMKGKKGKGKQKGKGKKAKGKGKRVDEDAATAE